MQWWGWLVLGAVLLGAEMFALDAQFYLVFLGISAALVGLFGLAGVNMPEWAEWLAFAGFAVITMVAFRKQVYQLVRNRTGIVEAPLNLGDRVTVPVRLEPGQSCRVEYRGSSWTARNADQKIIEAGHEAVIVQVAGLTLHVRAEG
jgi:membrane protein implicated in regulation of membrane protease activity